MKHPRPALWSLAFFVATLAQAFPAGPGQSLPNIVFILADDIGWADPGRYHEFYAGGTAPVPTPNLNRLCDQGMMFTDAQLPASLCAPNRFCIMTGNSVQRSREFGTWNRTASTAFHYGGSVDDRLNNPHRTVGTVLREAGYRTGYFGKMHFGGDFFDSNTNLLRNLENTNLNQIDFSIPFENGLLDHGFDYTFVSPDGIQGPLYAWFENDLYRPVSSFAAEVDGVAVGPDSVLRSFSEGETVGDGQIIVDGYGDSRFDTSDHGPILTHFAADFMHRHVANHPGQPFMVYYATPAIHVPLTPSVDGLEASGATGIGPRADFIFDLDLQVGRLLDTLDELGIADNTLVIFTSDNGGAISGGEGQIAAGQPPNGPLRGNKSSIYEGGHRVPMIWKWGDGTAQGSVIPTGRVCRQLVSVLDWVPSIIDLVGGAVAGDQHQDSVSLLPLLFSEDPDGLPPVRKWHYYYENNSNNRAARMDDAEGQWFYLRAVGSTSAIELYDLATDLGQTNNLVAGFPAVADLPADHPHRARIEAMEAWYLAHNGTYEARTEPALSYLPPGGAPPASGISLNLTEFATDVQQIDAGEVFGILEEESVLGGWINLNRINAADNLAFDNGINSTVDMTLTAPNDWASFNAAYNNTPLKGGIDDYTGTVNPTSITFSDLNSTFADGYKAIVYLTGFNGNTGASITDGNSTFYFQSLNAPAAPVTLVRTTTTTDNGDGNAPFAQYAVFGGETSLLMADSITFTIDTLYGGGSAIGGVQLLGRAESGSSSKTPIPVPVPAPRASLDRVGGGAPELQITLDGLLADVNYSLQAAWMLPGAWETALTISNRSSWNTNLSVSGTARFFRSASTNRVTRFTLPLMP